MVNLNPLVQTILSLGAATGRTNLTELFGPGLTSGAQIILREDTDWFTQVRQRWSRYQAPTYLGAIKPATEADVEHIVNIAVRNDVNFFTTGGGHGISDYSKFHGVAVDLSNFKSTHLDDENNLLTIGGATEYVQLSDLLYNARKELPLASCPCVGVLGATMGAGIGPLVGHRGLLQDALESVRIVTAKGNLVVANISHNEDLFWAIRGAGANFGIVTSATFKVYDITNGGLVTVADLIYPAAANQSFFSTLQTLDDNMPELLAITAAAVFNRELNESFVGLHAVYFGPEEDARRYLEIFFDLAPISETVSIIPQPSLFPPDYGACIPNQYINLYTTALKQIHPQTFVDIYGRLSKLWNDYPDYDGRMIIQRFAQHGVMEKTETSYPWRDAIAHVNVENFYSNTSHDEVINEFGTWARTRLAETSGYDGLATYVNYAHGDEGPIAWYSKELLPRLSATKRRWDPKGIFSWHNPVPLHWPEL